MITVLIVALVLGAYYYPACPKMLKDNKQMLLGVFVGLLAGQYLGVKIEGISREWGMEIADKGTVIHEGDCTADTKNPRGWFGIDDEDPGSPSAGELVCLDRTSNVIWSYICKATPEAPGEISWVPSADKKAYTCQ